MDYARTVSENYFKKQNTLRVWRMNLDIDVWPTSAFQTVVRFIILWICRQTLHSVFDILNVVALEDALFNVINSELVSRALVVRCWWLNAPVDFFHEKFMSAFEVFVRRMCTRICHDIKYSWFSIKNFQTAASGVQRKSTICFS